ncbi:hypothetical protein ACHAQA_004304 [Verticillium albo-atrum]
MKLSAALILTALTAALAAPAPAEDQSSGLDTRDASPGDWDHYRDHCKKKCHHDEHHHRCRKHCDDYDYSYKKKVTVTYTYTYCQEHDCGHDWYGRYGYDYYRHYGHKWGYKWDSYKWKRDEVPNAEAEAIVKREAEAAAAPIEATPMVQSEEGKVQARSCSGGGCGHHRHHKVHHHYYDNHYKDHKHHDWEHHKCDTKCDDRKYNYHNYDYCSACEW